jgi:hypothetical protein
MEARELKAMGCTKRVIILKNNFAWAPCILIINQQPKFTTAVGYHSPFSSQIIPLAQIR